MVFYIHHQLSRFLEQCNAICLLCLLSLCLWSLIILPDFYVNGYISICIWYVFFSLEGADRILRAISLLFLSNFFQSFIPAGKFMSFQLYLSVWGLIFDILSGWLLISEWCNETVNEYWKHLLALFLGFIAAILFFIHLEESIVSCLFLILCSESEYLIYLRFQMYNYYHSLIFVLSSDN